MTLRPCGRPERKGVPPLLAVRSRACHYFCVRVAGCDPAAFYPLRSLVAGPFHDVAELAAIERFMRTVVLHDAIVMEMPPLWYDSENDFEFTEEEQEAGGRMVITAFGPDLKGYGFFTDITGPERAVPDIDLSPALVEAASRHANAAEGNIYFEAAIRYLKRLLDIVAQGGSVLLCDEFGQEITATAQRYPEALFAPLDRDWQDFARQLNEDGLELAVPPVLGIVLTRCARREAIPEVLRDLRAEWSIPRKRVWERLDALRGARTLDDALDIRRELADASRLFSPTPIELDSRPTRVFWEIVAAGLSGATTGELSGGNPAIAAATNVLGQMARSFPALAQEFGRAMFGRGAFDLARKVRRASSEVEFGALRRLLTAAEVRKLGM